jgi:hypothetical protein
VSVATVYRRTRDPLFQAKLAEARAAEFRPLAAQAVAAVGPALDRLRQIAHDASVHASTRVRALVALVELALRLHSEVNVLPRLASLEAALAEHNIASPAYVSPDATAAGSPDDEDCQDADDPGDSAGARPAAM